MAITRTQIARQLYKDGTPMKKIKGQNHMLAYITPNEADKLVKLGGQETMTPEGIPAYPEFDNYTDVGGGSRAEFEGGAYEGTGSAGDGVIQKYDGGPKVIKPIVPIKKPPKIKTNIFQDKFVPPAIQVLNYFGDKFRNSKLGNFLNTKARTDYLNNLKEQDPDLYDETVSDLEKLGYVNREVELYGPEDKYAGRDIEKFENLYEDQAKSILNTVRDKIDDKGNAVVGTLYDDYLDEKMNRFTPDDSSDGIQDPCKGPNPPAYCFTGIRSAEPEEKEEDDEIINYRLFNEGGRAGLAGGGMPYEGGIMDLESARQMYGLGKLVKKVTRSVKKIAKSPIGKAAILAAGGYALGGGFAAGGFKKATLMSRLGLGGFENVGSNRIFQKNLLGKFITSPAGLIGATSIVGGLMSKTDEDDEEELYAGADLPFPVDYYLSGQYPPNMRLAAEGGLMRTGYQEGSKEPVAKKVMPLLDMDGKEKDYRETGGFVPIGRMEKADDVPARLSKNEFVFTADAVRNAGDGDVDKGAEVMYNMMKNLESGGDVSEESQGLEGAKEMFQTSQRLEEVL
jgi:hypothetical protein